MQKLRLMILSACLMGIMGCEQKVAETKTGYGDRCSAFKNNRGKAAYVTIQVMDTCLFESSGFYVAKPVDDGYPLAMRDDCSQTVTFKVGSNDSVLLDCRGRCRGACSYAVEKHQRKALSFTKTSIPCGSPQLIYLNKSDKTFVVEIEFVSGCFSDGTILNHLNAKGFVKHKYPLEKGKKLRRETLVMEAGESLELLCPGSGGRCFYTILSIKPQ